MFLTEIFQAEVANNWTFTGNFVYRSTLIPAL